MSLSPYELALIAGGFTIVGALIGGWIGYRNALGIYKITEFNKAATAFRNAFHPEVIYLRHNAKIAEAGSSSDLAGLLSSAYIHRHLAAIETFRDYLSPEERTGIDKAWQEYCGRHGTPGGPGFGQYSHKSTEREVKEEELKQLALQRIEKMFEFSKHK